MKPIIFLIFLFLSVTSAAEKAPYVDEALLNAVEKKYGSFAKKRFIYLQKTMDSLKDADELLQLEEINEFYNEVRYASDKKTYGQSDYWATPWEFLARDAGDCEDYVIAKYYALLHLGVDSKKLFFTYVNTSKFKEPHMVLTYFKTARSEPLILDNYNRRIFPALQRKDLTPIYNFNGESLLKASKIGTGQMLENKKSHKKWDELQLNIKRNKI